VLLPGFSHIGTAGILILNAGFFGTRLPIPAVAFVASHTFTFARTSTFYFEGSYKFLSPIPQSGERQVNHIDQKKVRP
jgi:hypothetical protein